MSDLILDEEQLNAIEKLKNGSILCGGVGSGKSRTGLAYYFFKECHGKVRLNGKGRLVKPVYPLDLYIITTARKRDTLEWEKELIPFFLSTDQDASVSGIKVVIDSWNNIHKYADVSQAFFMFDEQRVVGNGTWVKSFLKITKRNKWILLSATPGDKWEDYIPVFLANGFYKNRTEFLRRHAVYSRYYKYPKVEKWLGTRYLTELKQSILVEIKFDRPTISHKHILVSEYDKTEYKNLMKYRWNPYENKPIENISELCYLLRRIPNEDPSKLELLDGILISHDRVIIFYNFNYELKMLIQYAEENSIAYSQWNGSAHQPIPENKRWLYLVQYSAGAEGWNCTSTDTIVFYSLNYSYKQMIQAAGRIDRRDTTYKDLYYYYLRSTSPIDFAINRCLDQKKNFNETNFIKL